MPPKHFYLDTYRRSQYITKVFGYIHIAPGGTNGELWRIMANYGEGFYGELGQTQLRNSP